jgi:hypothetical protein
MGTANSITFTCREGNRIDGILVRTETVHSDGRVDVHVRGRVGSEIVSQRATRREGRTLDLAKVTAARVASGWTVSL